MTRHLLSHWVRSMPVPKPVTSSTAQGRRAAIRAAAEVVLPIPISPRTTHFTLSFLAFRARFTPNSKAFEHSEGVIADPVLKFLVPLATFAETSFLDLGRSAATPTSTTWTSAQATLA